MKTTKLNKGEIAGLIAIAIFAIALTGGCALMGANPKPPSKLEQAVYTTVTNVVPVIQLVTNTVPVTQTILTYKTNEVGVTLTNTLSVTNYSTNVVQMTNLVPAYTLTTSDTTKAAVTGIGTVANIAMPGVGSMVTGGILAMLAIWGHLRSSKLTDTSTALAQEVEAVREFIKTLPSGAKYDSAITSFLQSHQVEAGVAKQVLAIVQNDVSNPDAKAAAADINNTLAVLTKP